MAANRPNRRAWIRRALVLLLAGAVCHLLATAVYFLGTRHRGEQLLQWSSAEANEAWQPRVLAWLRWHRSPVGGNPEIFFCPSNGGDRRAEDRWPTSIGSKNCTYQLQVFTGQSAWTAAYPDYQQPDPSAVLVTDMFYAQDNNGPAAPHPVLVNHARVDGQAPPGMNHVTADGAVARAELIGLQAVEHPERVLRVAADIEVVDVDVLDHVVGIDHEGRTVGNALFRIANAEAIDQRAIGIGELPDAQLLEVLMVAAPGQLRELIVGGAAEHDRVAILEIAVQVGESDDLRRADEGEVLRIEEDDLPLARKAFLGDRLERAFAALFVLHEFRLHAGDLEVGKFVANAKHLGGLLSESVRMAAVRGSQTGIWSAPRLTAN